MSKLANKFLSCLNNDWGAATKPLGFLQSKKNLNVLLNLIFNKRNK